MTEAKPRFSFAIFKELLRNTGRVFKIIWIEKKLLILGIAMVFIIDGAGPFLVSGARGFLINELVKAAGSGFFNSILIYALAILIAAGFVVALFTAFQKILDRRLWFFIQEKSELLILKKFGEIDVATYENPKLNNLFQKVSENMYRIHAFAERQFFIFQNIFEVILASIILAASHWWLFLILLSGSLPELIIEARHGGRIWHIFHGRGEARRRYFNLRRHFEWLPKLIELKVFQNIRYFYDSIKDLLRSFYNEEFANEKRRFNYELLTLALSQAAIAFAIFWFVREVLIGSLAIGTFTFFIASIISLRQSLSSFFLNLARQYQDSLFVTDIFQMLNLKPAIIKPESGIKLEINKTPEIIFQNVTFAYPDTEKNILKNFSLTIPAGEKIAFVGANGAGKTTLIKLLCRFYDPDKGAIFINGQNIKDIDLESWYQQLGIIFQDYANYYLLVKEAIGIGRTSAKSIFQKVKSAAEASEANVFIEEWEKAYNQMLGKQFTGGIEPSIGQWQKLALARTFYRDPRVLILDEPTSSIDAESEAKIFEKLEQLPKDRTVILISHRFSTVRQADRICVIKNGQTKEVGTHEELLNLNGTYAKLFNIQARGYK